MPFIKSPQSPNYFAPAVYNTLTEGGALVAHKFDVQCKRHSTTDLKALDVDAKAIAVDLRDRWYFDRVITGWRGVQDPAGVELPFAAAAVDSTEQEFPGFVGACVRAFFLSVQPVEAAHLAAKN